MVLLIFVGRFRAIYCLENNMPDLSFFNFPEMEDRRMVSSRRLRNAFTLIELLVVIAIIAILAAILFPVFAQAREQARKTVCLSNLKQLNLGVQMYIQDYDETLPLGWEYPVPGQGYKGEGLLTWQDLIQPYGKNYAILFCPDSPYTNQAPINSLDYRLSYGIMGRAEIEGFPYWLTDGSNKTVRGGIKYYAPLGVAATRPCSIFQQCMCGISGYPPCTVVQSVAYSEVSSPSTYAFLFDSADFLGWHGDISVNQAVMGQCVDISAKPNYQGYSSRWSFTGPNPLHSGGTGTNTCDPADPVGSFNKGMANVSFMDGHAKSMKGPSLMKVTDDGQSLYYFDLNL